LCRLVVELPPLFPHPDQTKASWRSSRASSCSPYSPPFHQPQWVWLTHHRSRERSWRE
jgi:hypothetical protein